MSLSIGDILQGRYRIDGFLKRGGMGAVYKAWDTALDMPVAVKENTIETSTEAEKQFEREARILARLHHPNLPRVTNHFIIDNQGQYLVMDLVEGDRLDDILKRLGRPLGGEEVVSWIKQVCDALEYLHSQSPPIIHRDIKPQNIIVTATGRVMLVDFGIAKIYDPSQVTTVGAKGYTPGYSPLEQYTHDPTDARSDVYALGATLYVLLTNSKPPPEAIQRKIKKAPVVPPSQLNSELNREAEKVILRSLKMETQERYQTVTEFYNALEKTLVVDEKTVKTPPVRIRPSPPRWLLLGGAALLVILVVGTILLLTGTGLGSTSNTPAILAIEQAVIEIDGQTINADDFQAVTCDTSPRLEIKFLDANGQQIEPTLFSYNWDFEPGDQNNVDKTNSSNYATIYNVPCELDNQTVIVEVQKDGKTFFTKSLLFDITK